MAGINHKNDTLPLIQHKGKSQRSRNFEVILVGRLAKKCSTQENH